MRNLLFMGLLLTSCQFGPNYYYLPESDSSRPAREMDIHLEGTQVEHGYAYTAGRNAVLIAKDLSKMTDE